MLTFLRTDLKDMVSASRNYVVKINNVGAVSFRIFKLPVYVPNNAEAACNVLKTAFGDELLTCVEDIFTLEMINSAKPLTLDDVPPPPLANRANDIEHFANVLQMSNIELAS